MFNWTSGIHDCQQQLAFCCWMVTLESTLPARRVPGYGRRDPGEVPGEAVEIDDAVSCDDKE